MFSLIVLLTFSDSLITKCVSLNNEPSIFRSTYFDLNPVELKYYSFMIGLDKCCESCNVSSSKICVRKKTKDINVKLFNMIKDKNETKTITIHVSCDCKCKFNSTTFNLNQIWNDKTCQCERKNYGRCKKDYSWNFGIGFCENSKCLKSIADASVIECDEIISVMDIVSIK